MMALRALLILLVVVLVQALAPSRVKRILAWGHNTYGQCGINSFSDPILTPNPVIDGNGVFITLDVNVKTIATGGYFGSILTTYASSKKRITM
jgi:hypothetical protein